MGKPDRAPNGDFLPGHSIKSPGRTPIAKGGKPNAATLAKQAIEKDIGDVIVALINNAKAGDTGAAKILLDRVAPSLKSIEHLGLDGSNLPSMTINKTTTIVEAQPVKNNDDNTTDNDDESSK